MSNVWATPEFLKLKKWLFIYIRVINHFKVSFDNPGK